MTKRFPKLVAHLPYSETQPDLSEIIRSIPEPPGVTAFRTDRWQNPEIGLVSWCEAWKNPTTNLWRVDRYDEVDGVGSRQEIAQRSVCFFDALHYCAWFEAAERDFGESALPPGSGNAPHYREAARLANIPFDGTAQSGLPVPAAYGRILVSGLFDEEARAIARRTQSLALSPRAGAAAGVYFRDLESDIFQAPLSAAATGDELAARADQAFAAQKEQQAIEMAAKEKREKLAAVFRAASRAAQTVVENLKDLSAAGFKHKWGIDPALWLVDRPLGKLISAAESLPACAEKAGLQEFVRAAGRVFNLEHAARLAQQANGEKQPHGSRRRFNTAIRDGRKAIGRAVKKCGLPVADSIVLEARLMDGGFEKPGTFLAELEKMSKALRDEIIRKIVDIGCDPEAGETVPGKGVYIGRWNMAGEGENPVEFDFFAAPEDTVDRDGQRLLTDFNDASRHVGRLGVWHGYKGADYESETALSRSMRTGRYNGEWVIPPWWLLKHLEKNKDKGDFKDTFLQTGGYACRYLSCTQKENVSDKIWLRDFSNGTDEDMYKNIYNMPSRLVRAERHQP